MKELNGLPNGLPSCAGKNDCKWNIRGLCTHNSFLYRLNCTDTEIGVWLPSRYCPFALRERPRIEIDFEKRELKNDE